MGTLFAVALWAIPVFAAQDTNRTPATQPYIIAYNAPHPYEQPVYSKEYIISQIISQSKQSDVDPNLMLAISKCESGYQQKWNSRHWEDPDYYTAYGAFQIVAGHEKTFGFDRMTLDGNIQIAIRLFLKNGLKDWSQSLKCIQKGV